MARAVGAEAHVWRGGNLNQHLFIGGHVIITCMGNTALNVPVEVRSHELAKLHETIRGVITNLEDAEMDEAAVELSRVYEEHIEGIERDDSEAVHVSMPPEDWRIAIRYLNRARENSMRVGWLQSKLVDRLEKKMEEMGIEQ